MNQLLALFGTAAFSVLVCTASTLAQVPADRITILAVEPSGQFPADRPARVTIIVEVTVASVAEAAVALGFNSEKALSHRMGEEQKVVAGTETLRLSADTTPRDWGRLTGFHALVILRSAVETGVFTPLATATSYIPVLPKSGSPSVRTDMFPSLETPAKLAVLKDIASAASDLQATEILAVMHSALRDIDPSVRLAAVEAIAGRTQASDFLTVPIPPGYPSPADGRRTAPPAEWVGDGDVFRSQLQSELATMARRDEDERVRAAAIGALHHMVRLQGPRAYDGDVATVFVDVYRQDDSALARRQVVQMLALSTSDHADLRAVLRAAFVDRDATVRTVAAAALRKIHPALEPRLRYVDVPDEIALGLVDPNIAYRAAALNAVLQAASDARELISVLQRMAERDPDETIRQQARGVLELLK